MFRYCFTFFLVEKLPNYGINNIELNWFKESGQEKLITRSS